MPSAGECHDVLDYEICHYGGSRLAFRGPHRTLEPGYVVALGGNETFGRYIETPYPALVEQLTGRPCLNLGASHAGPDAFLRDTDVLALCQKADLTILQLPGAHAIQNRFFSLHTRRNDRLIQQTPMLHAVYPDVDFSRYHFVRHLLTDLEEISSRRFGMIRDELQRVWVQRINQLCSAIGGPVILLWMGDRAPDDPGQSLFEGDPPLVTREMLHQLRGRVRATVEVLDLSVSEEEALAGKVYPKKEAEAAMRVPGPKAHKAAAQKLAAAIRKERKFFVPDVPPPSLGQKRGPHIDGPL